MGEAAVALTSRAGYQGAGTCEFLLADCPPAGRGAAEPFYFLELNARLQVEHPVTELVCGLDLVEAQLRVAAGEPLWLTQADVAMTGHAVEARVCAEDPARGFLPGAGRIVAYAEPRGPGVRVDSGVQRGSEVTTDYDSLLAKVIAHAPTRKQALDRLDGALAHLVVLGPPTNTAFLRRLLSEPEVRAGTMDTGWSSASPRRRPTWPPTPTPPRRPRWHARWSCATARAAPTRGTPCWAGASTGRRRCAGACRARPAARSSRSP
jgi:acetyl-CoA/propionyl-CoA carboxylase biotin carboxyl carrier protein